MKNKLLIYGAGGLGREVLSMVQTMPQWEVTGFIDDVQPAGSEIAGIPVKGGADFLLSSTETVNVLLAIGNPLSKCRVLDKVKSARISFPSVVHPSVILQSPETIHIGSGSIVCAGSIITTHVRIGSHVLVNLKTTIGHDVMINDFTSVMPGVNIAGCVTIGEQVLIGSGASIINGVTIGPNARVGMGAVVIRNVAPGLTVAGVPAKQINT